MHGGWKHVTHVVTGDVVVIYTLDWCQKRNLTILTSHLPLLFKLQTTDGKLWPLAACWRVLACSHLHLVSVETHEPLNSDFLARACVVDVLPFLQTALVHPHIRQLAKPPRLLMTNTTGNNKGWHIEIFLVNKKRRNKDKRIISYLQFEGQTNIGVCRVSCRVHLNLWCFTGISTTETKCTTFLKDFVRKK